MHPVGNSPIQPSTPALAFKPTSKKQSLPLSVKPPQKNTKDIQSRQISKNAPLSPQDPKRFQEIESSLVQIEEKKETFTNAFEWVQWYTEYFSFGMELNELTTSTVEFFNHIFPEEINQSPEIKEVFNQNFNKLELLSALAEMTHLGLAGLTTIYKGKILKQVDETLEKTKKQYPNDPFIKEWEAKIENERAQFSSDSVFVGVRGLRNLSYLVKFTIEHLDLATLPAGHKIAELLGIAGSVFGTIISAISLSRSVENASTYKNWTSSLKKWQEKAWPRIKSTFSAIASARSTYATTTKLDDYRIELNQLIKNSKNISDLRSKLNELGVTLDRSISSKKEARRQINLQQYMDSRENAKVLDHIIHTSENLLEKRQAITDKKIHQLEPRFEELQPQIKEVVKPQYIRQLNELIDMCTRPQSTLEGIRAAMDDMHIEIISTFDLKTKEDYARYFNLIKSDPNILENRRFIDWFSSQSKESLLRKYVDHQATIAQTTKNSLIEMVAKKQEIEGKFVNFKVTESSVAFSIAAISLTITAVLTIVGLATAPVGGAALILLALSVGTGIVSLSMFAAGHYLAYRYRRSNYSLEAFTYSIGYQLFTAKVRSSIDEFLYDMKRRKFENVTHRIESLASKSKTDPKLVQQQTLLKKDLKTKEARVLEWKTRIEELENRRAQQSWQDFVSHARLRIGTVESPFDTLKAFTQAFEKCDLSLLDDDTISFLEVQLGIKIEFLQEKLKADPDAVKNTLQKFFTLGDSELVSFIEQQESRIRHQAMKPLAA